VNLKIWIKITMEMGKIVVINGITEYINIEKNVPWAKR
jgi:hypothetical protein